MVGRSPRSDVVSLVGYVSELLRRASAGLGRGIEAVVESVVAELPLPRPRTRRSGPSALLPAGPREKPKAPG